MKEDTAIYTEDLMPATKPAKEKDDRVKMTISVPKALLKQFKIHAIETDTDYSQLAVNAFREYLERHAHSQ